MYGISNMYVALYFQILPLQRSTIQTCVCMHWCSGRIRGTCFTMVESGLNSRKFYTIDLYYLIGQLHYGLAKQDNWMLSGDSHVSLNSVSWVYWAIMHTLPSVYNVYCQMMKNYCEELKKKKNCLHNDQYPKKDIYLNCLRFKPKCIG